MTYIFDEQVGLLKEATIVSYDSASGTIKAILTTDNIKIKPKTIEVNFPHSLYYNNGLFVGSKPFPGTPIIIGQGSGNQYYFVSFKSDNINLLPELNDNELLIKATDKTKLSLDTYNNIKLRSDKHQIHINSDNLLYKQYFNNQYIFTQGSRSVNAEIKRDIKYNDTFDQDSKLLDDDYDDFFVTIGLDPSATTNSIIKGSNKNPAFVEKREMIYEFSQDSKVTNDSFESSLYGNSKQTKINYEYPNRRNSRADTLSLSLVEPNYLMETIKGTVVDIFGNILDINRFPIPVGKDNATIKTDKSEDKIKNFLKIKELERKSLAYHFEINARKETNTNNTITLPDITSDKDYARNRSRFFIDIDKEGQFKINIPASSEKGNISLLSRYENYSTFGEEDNKNPNKLIYREDNLDIFQDSFAAQPFIKDSSYDGSKGLITIKSNDKISTPIDRITKVNMKHGTAYHDITATCITHQSTDFINYQNDQTIDITKITLLENVVSKTIYTDGDKANAGGRSGQINLDGSIELNIGANTVDRQSIWLDTAGGLVGNIGRDVLGRSMILGMDGDCLLQIGGYGISNDSRFNSLDNRL